MNSTADHFKIDADGARYAGDHLLVELWGAVRLADIDFVRETIEAAARAANATVLHSHYHHFGDGQGISGMTLLAESHVSIHTWPERAYAALDVFMCGACDPMATLPVLEQAFSPERMETRLIRRGSDGASPVQSVA